MLKIEEKKTDGLKGSASSVKTNIQLNEKKHIFKNLASIVFGIVFTFIFFEIILFAFGKLERIARKLQNSSSRNDEFVILALGESTTAPVYNFDMQDYSWPTYLEKILNKKYPNRKFKVINEGVNSITSDRIISDLEKNIKEYNPDLVISMMGINDFFGGIVYETEAGIKANSPLSKSRVYKLIKFLIANIKEKNELKAKEKLDCFSEESCIDLASQQKENDYLETQLAIKFLNKALEYNPNSVDAMIGLGFRQMYSYNYNKNEDVIKAMEWSEKALELDPRNAAAYNLLIQSLMNNISTEEKWIKKIEIEMNKIQENIEKYETQDADLFLMLATYETCPQETCYETKKSGNEKRIYYLNKALETDPQNPHVYLELARYHAQYSEFDEAEKFYLKVLENDVEKEINTAAFIELANLYLKTDRQELAKKAFKQAIDVDGMYVKNYRKLYQILNNKGIKLIIIQYPMRSIEPLELIFNNDNDDVLLVDNELLFKDLVKEEGYDSIFVDRFAGDFGHCSERGNLLLAENIKSVILENWDKISKNN